jgi:hypothetical protein
MFLWKYDGWNRLTIVFANSTECSMRAVKTGFGIGALGGFTVAFQKSLGMLILSTLRCHAICALWQDISDLFTDNCAIARGTSGLWIVVSYC